ncbi:MAG: DUF4153 domain-containing protein [Bacteroidota bacterium]
MKKNDVLLLVSVVLYSWFFYHQSLGINFLLFSVSLIALLLIRNKALLKDNSWYVAAAGTLVSAICVMLYGTWLAFSANIVSLSLLSAMSISKGSSVILAGLYSMYSYVSSIGFMIVDMIERRMQKSKALGSKFWIKLSIGIGIFVVIVLFFFLYQHSNPLFKNLTEKINLDFISWPWVRFTFLGFLLLYGFFYSRNFPAWHRWDTNIPKQLYAQKYIDKGNTLFGKKLNGKMEQASGVILLALLNVLLLVVNVLDIIYLWITKQIPEGMTLSEYLHQGTGTLIVAIVLAIVVILFYFRGFLNFSEKNKSIKMLAYVWIIQNAFVIVSTGYRNLLYVSEYSLTYKRLGIYIWLVLTFVGLITTIYKIYSKKTNLYLFKANGWSFYLVLVLFACLNWDSVITKFNISQSKTVDKNYLVELNSPANLPDLLTFPADTADFNGDENTNTEEYSGRDYYDNLFYRGNFTAKLHKRLYDFLNSRDGVGWQSWNVMASRTEKEIYVLFEQGKVSKLLLANQGIKSLDALHKLKNITYIDVSKNMVGSYLCLNNFDKLEYLNASGNSMYNLDSLPMIVNLKTLDLSGNYISDFSSLKRQSKLENLNIASNTGIIDVEPLFALKQLKTLDISGNEIKNINKIIALHQLRSLKIGGMKNSNVLINLPILPNLEDIDISNNSFTFLNLNLVDKFKEFQRLKKLNLSNNNMSNLYLLTSAENKVVNFFFSFETQKNIEPIFANLECLILKNNSIRDIDALKYYPKLKRIDLSDNDLESINALGNMRDLEYLNLSNTKIMVYDTLQNLLKLKELNISANLLTDISGLSAFVNLQSLDISNNQLTNIDRLSKCVNLRSLKMNNNQIADLAPLQFLKKLEILDVTSNSINDYSVLCKLTQLKELRVSSVSLDTYNLLKESLPNTKIKAQYIYKGKMSS